MKRWRLARRKNVQGWNIDGALMHPEESEMAAVQQVSRCTQVCMKGPGPAPWRIWRLSCRCLININRASRWPIIWTSPVTGKTWSRRQNVPCYSLFKFGIFDKFYVLFCFFVFFSVPMCEPMTTKWPWLFFKTSNLSPAWKNKSRGANQDAFRLAPCSLKYYSHF